MVLCTVGMPSGEGINSTDCNGLMSLESCTVRCGATFEGEPTTYTCDRGLERFGQFYGSLPNCTKQTCSAAALPSASVYNTSACVDVEVGQACLVSCPANYFPADAMYRCSDSLNYTGTPPTCEPIACSEDSVPSAPGVNGSACADVAFQDTCQAVCREGYTGTLTTLTCGSEGDLVGTAPTCELIPCEVPAALNISRYSHTCQDLVHGERCVIQCNSGYEGDPVDATCDAGNLTGGTPNCTGVACSKNVPYGTGLNVTDCGGKTTGEYCTVECKAGFQPVGVTSEVITCQANEAFSASTLECESAPCGNLDQVAGFANSTSFTHDCGDKVYQQTCLLQCATGFTGTPKNLRCNAGFGSGDTAGFTEIDGSLAMPLTCVGNPCTINLPSQQGVESDCDGKTTGETCTASVASGYTYQTGSEATTITCLSNGEFSGDLPDVQAETCPDPDLGEGVGSSCMNKAKDATCWAYCNSGYSGGYAQYKCDVLDGVLTIVPATAGAEVSCTANRRLAEPGPSSSLRGLPLPGDRRE